MMDFSIRTKGRGLMMRFSCPANVQPVDVSVEAFLRSFSFLIDRFSMSNLQNEDAKDILLYV